MKWVHSNNAYTQCPSVLLWKNGVNLSYTRVSQKQCLVYIKYNTHSQVNENSDLSYHVPYRASMATLYSHLIRAQTPTV